MLSVTGIKRLGEGRAYFSLERAVNAVDAVNGCVKAEQKTEGRN